MIRNFPLQSFYDLFTHSLEIDDYIFKFYRPGTSQSLAPVLKIKGKSPHGCNIQLSVIDPNFHKSVEVELMISHEDTPTHIERFPYRSLRWEDEKLAREIIKRVQKHWDRYCIGIIHTE